MARSTASAALIASAIVYLALLVYRYESVPGAPCNDTVEEALSGYLMIRDHDYQPIYTKLNPNGHEALHVLAVGALVHAWQGGTLAILVPSWTAALLLLLLLFAFARVNPHLVDERLVVPTALACLWMFHYARTGLRAVSSPVMLLLFVLLLQASLKRREVHTTDFLAGCVLALGTYGYTSFRLVVVAFGLFVLLEVGTGVKSSREEGRRRLRKSLAAAAGFLPVFSWNLAQAVREPDTFFRRGAYVLQGGITDWLANLAWTLLLPVHYPERYGWVSGRGYVLDPVAIALPLAGHPAIPPLLGAFFFVGLYVAVKHHRDQAVVRFLLLSYLVSVALLGISGPSLTRLYFLFPVIVILIVVGLSRICSVAFARRGFWVALSLYALAAYSVSSYFHASPSSDPSKRHGADMAASVGRRARELAEEGRAPLCIVSQDRKVVRYFTVGHWQDVRLREFHRRPFEYREVAGDLKRAQVVLIDDGRNLKPLVQRLEESSEYSRVSGRYFCEMKKVGSE